MKVSIGFKRCMNSEKEDAIFHIVNFVTYRTHGWKFVIMILDWIKYNNISGLSFQKFIYYYISWCYFVSQKNIASHTLLLPNNFPSFENVLEISQHYIDLKRPEILLFWLRFCFRFLFFSEERKSTLLLLEIGIIGRASRSLHVREILGILHRFRVD